MPRKRKLEPVSAETVIDASGGAVAVAAEAQITPQAVGQWVKAKRIPVDRVLLLERLSGIPRKLIRPDIYPD